MQGLHEMGHRFAVNVSSHTALNILTHYCPNEITILPRAFLHHDNIHERSVSFQSQLDLE